MPVTLYMRGVRNRAALSVEYVSLRCFNEERVVRVHEVVTEDALEGSYGGTLPLGAITENQYEDVVAEAADGRFSTEPLQVRADVGV